MTDEKQSKWKRKKQRRGFTVQLVVGEDDNLIQYLDNLQSGDRAQFMRAALYRGSKVKTPPPPQVVNYQTLQQELAALKSAITQSQSIAPAAGSDPDTVERIDYLHRWLEDITAQLPKFIDDRIARLVPDGFIAGAQPGADFIGEPEPQRVDPAELEKRGKRIKAATW